MRFLMILFFVLSGTLSKSQILKGKWVGKYITADSSYWETITLNIEWINNAYVIKSYSKGKDDFNKDTIIVCKMEYKLISNDSLVLFEKEILEPIGINPGICYQTMELKYETIPFDWGQLSTGDLWGIWYCDSDKNKGNGFVRFKRVEPVGSRGH